MYVYTHPAPASKLMLRTTTVHSAGARPVSSGLRVRNSEVHK